MTQYCVQVEFGNDDDPPSTHQMVGPFRTYDKAKEISDRINDKTETANDAARDASMGEVSRRAMVYRFRQIGEVINSVNEYLMSCVDEEPEGELDG